jgi:hydroxyacylglutathione hydrolase
MSQQSAPAFRVAVIPVTGFQQNCSIVYDNNSKRGAVVDPGGDVAMIMEAIAKMELVIEKILLTHGHIDHAGGAAELRGKLNVKIEGPHEADAFLLDTLPVSGARYGMVEARAVTPDRWLKDGDEVTAADFRFAIIHAPGHSPGSVVFFNAENRFALMGDVLFQGSIGRTDLPGGNHETLLASIREKVLPLGDDVVFLPGHGSASRIGDERASNPFLTGRA